MKRIFSAFVWLRSALDLRDLHYYGGLTVAAVGGWQISPAITLVALGAVLALTGIIPPRSQPPAE